MADIKFITIPSKRLAESITATSTLLKLNNIEGWDGEDLTSGDFGDLLYAVLRNDQNTVIEIIELDPTTIANATTTGITINKRGLQFDGDLTTEVSANKLTWVKNETIVELGTNAPQLLNHTVRVIGAQTIAGIKTFSSLPATTAGDPVADNDLARKAYIDAAVSGSFPVNRIVVAGTAGATVAAGDLIYFDTTDDEWKLCDADTAASVENVLLGIAQGAGTDGNAITNGVLIQGTDSNQSGLTVGDVMYASNTAGEIASSAGTTEVTVGIAKSATELYFSPRFTLALTKTQQDAIPSTDEKAALAGSSGSPGAGNTYVTEDDVAENTASKVIRRKSDGSIAGNTLLGKQLADTKKAAEAIAGATLPVPVCIVNDLHQLESDDTDLNFGRAATNNTQVAIQFTPRQNITVSELKAFLRKFGSPTDNVFVEIQGDSAGSPDGSAISNGTSNDIAGSGLTTSYVETTITFAAAFSLTANTPYWIVFQRDSTLDNSNYYQVECSSDGDYGNFDCQKYNGSAWSDNSDLIYIEFSTIDTGYDGYSYYKAKADDLKFMDIVGIVVDTVSAGDDVEVKTSGIVPGWSGLTQNTNYYLQDTAGTIGTSVGTFEAKIGFAVSTTELLIQRGSFEYIGSASDTADAITVPPEARFAIVDINVTGSISTFSVDLFLARKGKTSSSIAEVQDSGGSSNATGSASWSGNTITLGFGANATAVSGTAYFFR